MLTAAPIRIARLSVETYAAPAPRPVRTAFGVMSERPAVVVRIMSDDGVEGLGEVWCNFPPGGAAHRAHLVAAVLAPQVVGREWLGPQAVFEHLTERTRILGIQTGEAGPLAQAIAGMDIALWDLAAKRAGLPLYRFLGAQGAGRVPVYASGIGPTEAAEQSVSAQAGGHSRFKIKVGFDDAADPSTVESVRTALGTKAAIAVDANQAWSPSRAADMIGRLGPFELMWVEEPIHADSPPSEWVRLVAESDVAIAAGENLRGSRAFKEAIVNGVAVLQPDVCKWGGISGCAPVARDILAAGRRFCPHYLGGGIGLMASAHLLAAIGGDGLLEFDVNPNPLREGLVGRSLAVADGELALGDAPGIGALPDPTMVGLRTSSVTVKA